MTYSGTFRRLFAFLIDSIVMIGCYLVLGIILRSAIFLTPLFALPMLGFWFFGGLFFFAWFYFAGFESSKWQATIGKKLLELKVVDLEGNRVSFARATGRYFGKLLSRITLMIGFLMIIWTKKKQALHDKLASTLVIHQ